MRASTLRCLPLIIAAGTLPLVAQTTGSVQGRVLDPKGAPLAGARVALTGANLQGTRLISTDGEGAFRLSLLPPGPCVVTVTRDGFNTYKSAVQVGLDRTSTVEVKLTAIAQAVVEVVDQSTSVDTKATTQGANFSNESFEKLPVSRDFANIALLAPGVTKDDAGFKVYGASGAENNYVIDGINTTGVEFGTQGKKVPMEFIQEFQVKTGGYEAEYGKALGGVINVITKSGGNEFSGDVFAYSEGEFFKSGNRHVNDTNLQEKPLLTEDKTFELGFDVGGFLVKDKVWFFVAYDRRRNNQVNQIRVGTSAGLKAPTDSSRELFAGKLTWKMAEGHTLIGSFLGDPEKITGAVKSPQGDVPTWDGEHKVGGTDLSLRYEATGANWFGHFQVSRHNETNSILPGAGGASAIQVTDNATGENRYGFGRFDEKTFSRDTLQGSFAYILGGHELKAGFEFQTDKADIRRGFTGGQQVTILGTSGPNTVYSHYWWTTPDAVLGPPYDSGASFNAPSINFTSTPKHESQAYFLQDKWAVNPNWTLNLGVRLDLTDIVDPNGVKVASFKNQWAPRLGLVWDFKGSGTDKVYASASRYYEQVPLDLVIRSFSMERNPTTYNFSATAYTPNSAAETAYWNILLVDDPTASRPEANIYGYTEPVDPDIKGSYSDEFILGVETTVASKYVLGAKFIRRYLGRAIEDALDPNSPNDDYNIINPGQSHPLGITLPDATRDYRGVELTAQRKFADHYTWQASYLWSKLDGNYEGAFQGIGGADGTGQLDPNINAAYDLPEFIPNSWGRLSGDRRHQVKANGYYEWDFGLSLGASFQYMSGTPISRLGYHTGYGRYELFLTPRGTDGETPATTQLDLNLAYSLKITKKMQVRFNLDITNALNSQTATVIDQRFNTLEGGPQRAGYQQPFAFQAPRSVRIGARFSF
ncbi:MAG TPA: TonB-dependent receptor [Holophagaceae bacterium]|nr:TonB-dependent receptor [Holophagaceae bacterium]